MSVWEEVEKKYPDIHAVLDDIYHTQLVLLDKMHDLDEHYPVEGYEWDCDPNNIGLDFNPWGLYSKAKREEAVARCDAALVKQKVCVEGIHHFKTIGDVKWCQYCGTIKTGEDIFYPEQPHFLPKKNR